MEKPEVVGYAIAVIVIVVGGALVRTPILNWIVGPSVVVASVALSMRFAARRQRLEDQT